MLKVFREDFLNPLTPPISPLRLEGRRQMALRWPVRPGNGRGPPISCCRRLSSRYGRHRHHRRRLVTITRRRMLRINFFIHKQIAAKRAARRFSCVRRRIDVSGLSSVSVRVLARAHPINRAAIHRVREANPDFTPGEKRDRLFSSSRVIIISYAEKKTKTLSIIAATTGHERDFLFGYFFWHRFHLLYIYIFPLPRPYDIGNIIISSCPDVLSCSSRRVSAYYYYSPRPVYTILCDATCPFVYAYVSDFLPPVDTTVYCCQ